MQSNLEFCSTQASNVPRTTPHSPALRAKQDRTRVCFNKRDGNCAEKDVARAVGSGYTEGARAEDGGQRAAAYGASGAGADCAGAVLQFELRVLQRIRQGFGAGAARRDVPAHRPPDRKSTRL